VGSAAGASGSERDGFKSEGERNIGVSRGAEKLGTDSELGIHRTDGSQQRRAGGKLSSRPLADQSNGVREMGTRIWGMSLSLSTGLGDGTAELLLKFVEAARIRGTEIDFEDCLLGNGVDRGSPLDESNVEGGAGSDGQRDAEECIDGERGGYDGVGSAVIAPGMPPGPEMTTSKRRLPSA